MQRNMEEALRNIADNTCRRDNQGGREVNQYSTFKDFMDTKPPVCNIPDVTVTKIRIMASPALHSIVVKHNLMHQLKMSLIWLNVLRKLKCVYLVH